MDPLLPAGPELLERGSAQERRRKIQFSVPSSIPTQLDPRQVEMIRRRRPTPATLFRLNDPPSPEEEVGCQWVLGENGARKAKLVNTSVYQPPSLKAVQRMAQAHLQSVVSGPCGSVEREEPSSEEEVEREGAEHLSAMGAAPETDLPGDGDPAAFHSPTTAASGGQSSDLCAGTHCRHGNEGEAEGE